MRTLGTKADEFETDDFEAVWQRTSRNSDGTYLPDPLDLVVTKLNTGRQQDIEDSRFLESLVLKHYTYSPPEI